MSRKHCNNFTIGLAILLKLYHHLFFFAYCITDSFTEMSKIEKHTIFDLLLLNSIQCENILRSNKKYIVE